MVYTGLFTFVLLPFQADLLNNCLFLIVDMDLCGMGRCGLILVQDALINNFMLLHQPFMLAGILNIFETIPVHLLGQIVYQL